MRDYNEYQFGKYVPDAFVVWVRKRPVINSLICIAAGVVIGWLLF